MQFNWNFLGRWTGDNASYDCGRVQSLLSLYVDSMTSRVERDAIDTHLEGCESCRQQSDCLRSIHRVVSSRPIAEPPSDLKMRIAQAIAAERAPVRRAPRLRVSYGVLAGACSVLLCFVVAGERYASYLAAQNPGTTVKTVVAVNPVKAPSIAHVDTTKVATNIVPDGAVVSHESVRASIHSNESHAGSIPNLTTHSNEAPITAPIYVAVKPVTAHHPVMPVHTMQVATGNTTHTTTSHAAPPVLVLPHNDVTPPSNVTPAPAPELAPTPPTVVVASAGSGNSSMVRNADLLGSVRNHIDQFKMPPHQPQYPCKVLDTALETSKGTVDIVGSPFN